METELEQVVRKNCCCCIPLRMGCTLIGAFYLIRAAIFAPLNIWFFSEGTRPNEFFYNLSAVVSSVLLFAGLIRVSNNSRVGIFYNFTTLFQQEQRSLLIPALVDYTFDALYLFFNFVMLVCYDICDSTLCSTGEVNITYMIYLIVMFSEFPFCRPNYTFIIKKKYFQLSMHTCGYVFAIFTDGLKIT